jgi:hypothetical protein
MLTFHVFERLTLARIDHKSLRICDRYGLEGGANGAPHPDESSYAKKFSGKYAHRIIKGGVVHNLPQEAPQDFAKAVVDVDRY